MRKCVSVWNIFSKVTAVSVGVFCLQAVPAWAGWSSGGGELFRDQNNPWFVKNTTQVSVCVEIDENNFGLTRQEATAQLQDVIQYWKKQLSSVRGQNYVGIATQDFKFGDCTEITDLKVQFGTLEKKQEEFLGVPQKYVSAAVRTSYDTVNMKGKGFIYVSPQEGPLRMQMGRDSMEHPWEHK